MKRFMGIVLLIALQLGTAVGWLAYGGEKGTEAEERWISYLELPQGDRQMQSDLAQWYNLNLRGTGEGKPLEGYGQILYLEDGLMCGIEFPQGQKLLPVWHGARERKDGGLTHLSRSALPVGGKGNHMVFFCRESDLEGMVLPEKDEVFQVRTLGKDMAYRVFEVEITKGMLDAPEGEADKDLCSIWVRRDADWVIIRGVRDEA